MTTSYDVIVIGIGSAGSRAALAAHQAGARVLAIEGGEELGGLCILRGCMPTKTLLETAHRIHDARDSERFGFRVRGLEIDFIRQMERMRSLVARFQRAKAGSIEGAPYELRRGRPKFVAPHAIELDGEHIEARAFVLTTGSRTSPFPPNLPQVEALTSDDMFLLEEPPESVLVLGGGAVGLEFAQWLARVGTEVTLAVRSPLLHKLDPELGSELGAALAREMTVLSPSLITSLEQDAAGRVRAVIEDAEGVPRELEVQHVLNATGRVPDFDGLELEATGLAFDARGTVPVDESLRSAVPHVFLAGDACDRTNILHEANREGLLAGRNAARVALGSGETLEEWDGSVPSVEVIFTDPPLASVGETPVAGAGRERVSAVKRFPEQGRGIVMGAEHGFLRLTGERGSGKITGCQILGPRADDLIHVPATVMAFGGTAEDMLRLPWYHPTLCEAFVETARQVAAAAR